MMSFTTGHNEMARFKQEGVPEFVTDNYAQWFLLR